MAVDNDVIAFLNQQRKPVPEPDPKLNEEKPVPDVEAPDKKHSIEIDGKVIEIKPTLLKYFRNNMVSFYNIIDTVPLPTIYQMTEENSGIDGDKSILTFISAVLDDPKLAKKIYEKMDAGQLFEIVSKFKEINGIQSREEARKNALATRGKA